MDAIKTSECWFTRVPSSVVALVYCYLAFEEQSTLLVTCTRLYDVSRTAASHPKVVRLPLVTQHLEVATRHLAVATRHLTDVVQHLRQGDMRGLHGAVCARLFGMMGTRELYMGNVRVGDRDAWNMFAAMSALTTLQIGGVPDGFRLPSNLRRLELWLYTNGTDARISVHFNALFARPLSALEHLEELCVSPAALMADAVHYLPRTLTLLQICSANPNPTLDPKLWNDLTRRLPRLTSLSTSTRLDCADPLPLLDLPKLVAFDFSGFTGSASRQLVRQWSHSLTNLCSVTFSCDTRSYRTGFDFAAQLPCLHTLRITTYPESMLRFVCDSPLLASNSVNAPQQEYNSSQTETLTHVLPPTRFRALTSLSVTDSPNVTSLGWIRLVAPTLTALDMSRTRLYNLTELATLTHLQTLILDDLYQPQPHTPYPVCTGTLSSVKIASLQRSSSFIRDCITNMCINATIRL
jgi:hypothetical protein